MALGAALHVFPYGHQRKDHGRRLEIQVHRAHVRRFQISSSQLIAHDKQLRGTVTCGCRGTHRHQRVHIGRAVKQRPETVLIIFSIQIHDRKRQEKLGKREHHYIFLSQQNPRQRPSKHVSHGHIHQNKQERDRPCQTVLHLPRFVRGLFLKLILLLCLVFLSSAHGSSISCLLHGVYDFIRVRSPLLVFHFHGILEQIDLDTVYARHFADCFFYMGAAGTAAHAGHIKLLFHLCHLLSNTPPGCPVINMAQFPAFVKSGLGL